MEEWEEGRVEWLSKVSGKREELRIIYIFATINVIQ